MVRDSTALIALAALALAGCSSDAAKVGAGEETVTVTATPSSDASSVQPSTSSPEESSTSTSSASSSSSATGEEPSEVGLATDPGSYADAFVRAWGIGDRLSASKYATEGSTSALFAYDPRGGSSWTRDSSVVQGNRTQVRYTDGAGGSLYVLVDTATAQAGRGDAIVAGNVEWEGWDPEPEFVPPPEESVRGLPSTIGDYCDALVRAWGANNRGAAGDYATPAATSTLFDALTPGRSDWARVSVTDNSATYANDAGNRVTIFVDPGTVSSGVGDGAYYVSAS